jgi:Cytochrome P460
MRTALLAAGAAFAAILVAGPLLAGPERVAFPKGFEANWVLYNMVDRPDRKRVRFMYVNPEANAAARAGEPLPDGTVLVMADRNAKLDASENPVLDAEGRIVPEGGFTAIFVMEKQFGWGQGQPPEMRNGDWDYAAFKADGTLSAETDTGGCFACHNNRPAHDFTFTYFKNVFDRGR